jgi:putative aldouronate transport system substrate-binding protein
MKKFARFHVITCAAVASSLVFISACSEPQAAMKPKDSAAATDVKPADPNAKYDPPITITTVRPVDASFKYAEGESIDKNIWTPIFENEFGIKVKNLWVVDSSQYRTKLNITIASGELPDFFEVNKTEFQRLLDSDAIEDLTNAYEKFASPYSKSVLMNDGGVAMNSGKVGGKLMGIPKTGANGGVSAADMLWIRTDWLKKLNLPEPKTMEDVLKIAEAFAKNDPDGNGKADTVGLGINKDLADGHTGSIKGFLNSYHAYPDIWVPDASGKLVYGSIQPEMKTALQVLQNLYKNGVLDKELAVKNFKKVAEDIMAGKLGLAYGNTTIATGEFKEMRNNDKNAQWQAYPIVSVDSKPAIPQTGEPTDAYYVVRKGFKNPEAVFKLFNIYNAKYWEAKYAKPSDNPFAIQPETNIFPAKYAPIAFESSSTNLDRWRLGVEALKAGDGSKLPFPASLDFERITKYRAGDQTMWFSDRTFGPEGSFSVIDHYVKNKIFLFNAYLGASTPTMVEKLATLQTMQIEIITKIIMGAAPVSDFDAFIDQWKKQGGDKITAEVNEWYSKNKK